MMHVTFAEAAGWVAAAGGAWAIVRAGAAKGVLRAKAPAPCAACGRKRVWGRCACNDGRRRPR